MRLKAFLHKINPKLILVHTAAMYMFMYAFMLLFSLCYMPFAKAVLQLNTNKDLVESLNRGTFGHHWGYYITFFFYAPFIGLLTAFIISLTITIYKKWFWLNSLLAFIIMYLLYRFDVTAWNYLKVVLLAPGAAFENNLYLSFSINACVLLLIGLLLFFMKEVERFTRRIFALQNANLQQV